MKIQMIYQGTVIEYEAPRSSFWVRLKNYKEQADALVRAAKAAVKNCTKDSVPAWFHTAAPIIVRLELSYVDSVLSYWTDDMYQAEYLMSRCVDGCTTDIDGICPHGFRSAYRVIIDQ